MWALWYGVGTGLLLVLVGWLTYMFAPRVGPNPLFGVRTGYSMVNREVWNKSNRAGGIAIALVDILVTLAGVVVGIFGPRDTNIALLTVMGVLLVSLLMAVVWIVLYSRRLARGVPVTSARPIRLSMGWVVPAGMLAATLALFLVATASQLPADRVATHFGMDGMPNDWMSRTAHTVLSLSLTLGMFILDFGIVYLVAHVSIPGADEWPITGESVMRLFAFIMIGIQVLLAVVFLDIYWFNTQGTHPIPLSVVVVLSLSASLVALPAGIVYVVVRGKR